MERAERGRWAESAVERALVAAGYRVVGRNVRLQRGELDLVVARAGRLWFVETKGRGRRDRGPPHLAIDARKRRALFAAAREYVVRHRWRGDFGFLAAWVVPAPADGRPCVTWSVLPMTPGEGAAEL